MALIQNEIDAGFYNLIHRLVASSERPAACERRDRLRHAFRWRQRVAALSKPGVPDESEFIDVQCCDLSRQGFSFLFPGPPDFHMLVASFGRPPEVIYVSAEVVRTTSVLAHTSGDIEPCAAADAEPRPAESDDERPAPMVLVGCRFLQRLER
jgi:hypothetical protein